MYKIKAVCELLNQYMYIFRWGFNPPGDSLKKVTESILYMSVDKDLYTT